MEKDIFIRLENLSKTFPGVKALQNVSFEIEHGKIHTLTGENGAGKSTLIKILAGIYDPDEGSEIYIEDELVTGLTPITSVKKGIAVTYQDFSLFPNLSVAENIAISTVLEEDKSVVNWKYIRDIAKTAIAKLGENVSIDIDTRLGSLSTAKQQLVAIARALVYDAKLIILDEPTSSLSAIETETLFKIIFDLKAEGISVLFISHKLDEVFRIADRMIIMRDGQYMGTYSPEDTDRQKVISLMVGRNVEFERKEEETATEAPLLEVKGLSKKGNYADIDFTLHKGEILVLTGLVGAGRTEVAETLFGINVRDKGEVLLEGKPVDFKNTTDAMNAGFGYIPEGRQVEGLVLANSVEENITINILKKLTNKFNIINREEQHDYAKQFIDMLKVRPPNPEMQVSQLSGGNQQRVVIAKWLSTDPKVLIVDEPTNGVDVGAKEEIHNILYDLAGQGIGILMISSDLSEALAVSDRILVMRKGRIVAEFDGDEATQEAIMNVAIL